MVFQSTLELKEHLGNKQTTLGLKETDMFSLPDVTFIRHKRILRSKDAACAASFEGAE